MIDPMITASIYSGFRAYVDAGGKTKFVPAKYPHKTETRPFSEWAADYTTPIQNGSPEDVDDPDALNLGKHKTDLCLWAEIVPGAQRTIENIINIQCLVADWDAGSYEDFMAYCEKLNTLGAQYLVYTSYRNSGDQFKARVVAPLLSPVPMAAWSKAWDAWFGFWDRRIDKQCSDPTRFVFVAATYDATQYNSAYVTGRPIDWAKDLPTPQTRSALPTQSITTPSQQATGAAITRMDLQEWAKSKSKGARGAKAKALCQAVKNLAHGLPYAEEGSRHSVMVSLTFALDNQYPSAPAQSIVDLFDPSLREMYGADSESELLAVANALDTARAKREQRGAEKQDADTERQRRWRAEAWATAGIVDDRPYTQDDIDAWAASINCEPSDFESHWILHHGSSMRIFCGGKYTEPFVDKQWPVILRLLQPAIDGDFLKLIEYTETGVKNRSKDDILKQYARAIRETSYSWVANRDSYDARTATFTSASAPHNPAVAPSRSQVADDYFSAICETDIDKALLLRWLTFAPDPSVMLPALYVVGASGAGKNTLANSIAALWEACGSRDAEKLTSRFNFDLIRSPVIFADEQLPTAWKGEEGNRTFRAFTGDYVHKVEQKFVGCCDLYGYPRVIVAANKDTLFAALNSELPSEHDRAAIDTRVIQIFATPAGKEYIDNIVGADANTKTQNYMAFVREVAGHILWVAGEKMYEHKGRMGFDGVERSREVSVTHDWSTQDCVGEWIVKHLTGHPSDSGYDTEIDLCDFTADAQGRLLVSSRAMSTKGRWERYVAHVRAPSAAKIAQALAYFSTEGKQARYGREKKRAWEISIDKLTEAAKSMGVDTDQIADGLRSLQSKELLRSHNRHTTQKNSLQGPLSYGTKEHGG